MPALQERHSSAATLHRAGAAQQPAPAPGHMVPGTLLSHPGHAPAPNHHLSTAPELITEGQVRTLFLCTAIAYVDW